MNNHTLHSNQYTSVLTYIDAVLWWLSAYFQQRKKMSRHTQPEHITSCQPSFLWKSDVWRWRTACPSVWHVMFNSWHEKKSRILPLIEDPRSTNRYLAIHSCCSFLHETQTIPPEGMSWNYSCFHAHSAFLSVLQVKWSTLCQHLAVNLLSYLTLYHSACWEPPHDPRLRGRRDAETGFLSLICLAWPT